MEFVRILLCFKSIFGTLADRYIFKITNARLKSITNERNVAYFINTIECKYRGTYEYITYLLVSRT